MINRIEDLTVTELEWLVHPDRKGYYYAKVENQTLSLRLNDFPEEPLYTLIWKDQSIDLEEKPSLWRFK